MRHSIPVTPWLATLLWITAGWFAAGWFAAGMLAATECLAQGDPPADSVDRDYRSELPRIPPTEPADALATFNVAEGFRIELVAAEPLVVDPIAMAFDEHGRLFVVEMRGYSEQADENLGRIRLLEDQDGDGRFDASFVYADGLSWPTAVACYDGGVFVGAAPHIYYLRDEDGDRRTDVREVVFTGFGRGNVQGLLNTFKWGLDNRLHGATSSSGGAVERLPAATALAKPTPAGEPPLGDEAAGTDGAAPEPAVPPLALRGRDFAIEPRSMTIAATSGGGQHGLSFNAWGDKFVCSNSDHIQHVRFEDRCVARNAYFAPPNPRASIAADGPQADVFRASPVEPWRIVRTRLRVQGLVPGPVEGGGTPAGYFTGATGATIYRGDAWPDAFSGWAIVGDVGSNLVHRKRLEERGASYVAHRFDQQSEFVASSDIWFRPAQFANGPDGTLYIADMYREVIEHPLSLPPVIKQHLDLTSGRDRGRIYRLVPEGFQQPDVPALGDSDTATLVRTLRDANGWRRETAARLLYERQDLSAVPQLEALAASAERPETRVHALYALDGLDALSPTTVLQALSEDHPRVREHAVRLSERVAHDSPDVRQRLYERVDDPAFRVRYQLAFTLGELTGAQPKAVLAALIRRDGRDALMRVAVMSSLGDGAGAVLAELARDESFRATPLGRDWLATLSKQIGKQQRADDVAILLGLLRELSASDEATTQAVVEGLAIPAGDPLHAQLAAVTGGKADELLKSMLAAAATTAVDAESPEARRIAAVQRLRLGSLMARRDLFAQLLAPHQPAGIQQTAIATLASFRGPAVAELLVEHWPAFSPGVRTQAAEVLFSREAWLPTLLAALEQGRIAAGDLDPTRLRLLTAHRDPDIRKRAAELLAANDTRGRADVLAAYQPALDRPGDAARGKELFKKVCAACHQLDGVGHATGPNLAAMRNRGPDAILTNVLAPNREVNPQYVSYVVITNDGRSLTGMIAAETATSVTLRRADNATETVLRVDIDELRSTGVSLMPEGLEKQIDVAAMADLLAYLQQAGAGA